MAQLRPSVAGQSTGAEGLGGLEAKGLVFEVLLTHGVTQGPCTNILGTGAMVLGKYSFCLGTWIPSQSQFPGGQLQNWLVETSYQPHIPHIGAKGPHKHKDLTSWFQGQYEGDTRNHVVFVGSLCVEVI